MRLRREITPGTIVYGDPERLRQAFVNVLHNATQAVEAGQPEGGGELVIRSRREGKHIVLSVSDNGCGMSAEVAGRMFEPLFSTKAFGVGLGMPLVKRTVEQHGGAVAVESEPDRGTTVLMRLPYPAPRLEGA